MPNVNRDLRSSNLLLSVFIDLTQNNINFVSDWKDHAASGISLIVILNTIFSRSGAPTDWKSISIKSLWRAFTSISNLVKYALNKLTYKNAQLYHPRFEMCHFRATITDHMRVISSIKILYAKSSN